ncbi:MAG TPA: iron-containing alcohol dehydrogenase, partial [Thermoplasmata archaeon]|nr:iron-containing alcohol dehydrogenase [Thermoplasmata archaeon]
AYRALEELQKAGAVVERLPVESGPPTPRSAQALAERLAAFHPDWIVALGGGRTIDLAKAAWIRWVRPDAVLESLTPLTELGLRTSARFVAIPTTSGSGSDVGWTAFLQGDDGRPIELASRELVPDWSLLDPALPESQTPEGTANGAAEALAHAVEAAMSEWANPISDAFSRAAVEGILRDLPRTVKDPGDREARSSLHVAASMAGLAASNAQLGAAHALALALASATGVPYGRLVGTLLPYVLEFNYPSARERLGRFASVLGGSAGSDRSAAAERTRTALLAAGIPRDLAGAGVPANVLSDRRAEIVAWARGSSASASNPRVPSEEEYHRLLESAYRGTAVTY